MTLDQLIIKLSSVKIVSYDDVDHIDSSILVALSNASIGCFKWDIDHDLFYMSNLLYDMTYFDRNFDGSLLDLINILFNKTSSFQFLNTILDIYESKGKKQSITKVPSKFYDNREWLQLTSERINVDDTHCIVGTIQYIDNIKSNDDFVYNLNQHLFNILDDLPVPIYYYDNEGNEVYRNAYSTPEADKYNALIDRYIHNPGQDVDLYDILDFEPILSNDRHQKFTIGYYKDGKKQVDLIHRLTVSGIENNSGTLYFHEEITEEHNLKSHMLKVLKVNELTLEIKDMLDTVESIEEIYDFVLPKLHTVIPGCHRACVLRLDSSRMLYMMANYGYTEDYERNLKFSFETSFANLKLKNDFTKSMIIDDIQDEFSNLFPDINQDQYGFVMESNITAPIVINDELYGLLSLDSTVNRVFDEVDLNLIDYIKMQLERTIVKFKNLKQVKDDSQRDALTGVYNRRYLTEAFRDYAEKSRAYDLPFSLVIFDLDDLKVTNDQYGHLAGDDLIKYFAQFISKEIRTDDLISRYGGDEFIALFWDISEDELAKKLKGWRNLLNLHPIHHDGEEIYVKFSFGISNYPEDSKAIDMLIKKADIKLYDYKKNKA